MIKKYFICVFFVTLTCFSIAQSTVNVNSLSGGNALNVITTAVPFLEIAPDARAGGMGDAGVSTPADASSIHWNPAKLAYAEKDMCIGISYTPWLRALVPDINLAYLSAYKKFGDDQAFAMSLLYFSLGNITFTDNAGNETGNFSPNEFAIDVAYSRKLAEDFSGGIALRYIYSNLTGGFNVQGQAGSSHAGTSVAADISAFYNHEMTVFGTKSILSAGIDISNIGAKMAYTQTGENDFIPTMLKIGPCLKMNLDDFNSITFTVDFDKLLVPTPPQYALDSAGQPIITPGGTKVIAAGLDPNVSVPQGMIQSFYDAPGGFSEQMKEFDIAIGTEYWYDKQFAFRAGYFYEPVSKGGRQFFTLGAGLKYNVFGLDFAYLIPTDQRNPLENTLRFTLLFDFDAVGKDKPATTN